jgi:hypothetical protein
MTSMAAQSEKHIVSLATKVLFSSDIVIEGSAPPGSISDKSRYILGQITFSSTYSLATIK